MDIHDKSRVKWACRRGMLELDVSIMPFFHYEYDSLSDEDKRVFVALLKSDDPDLFNWMMDHGERFVRSCLFNVKRAAGQCKLFTEPGAQIA
ncbi:hypothetical protein CRX72_03260 [Pantoea sp. BRM17]|nr:hypothetical protein CRX72_03260 [Pantoea sp. BRM17]